MTIPTPDNAAEKKLFHNEWLNVYPTTLPLEEIQFWKENDRTIFTFERLCRQKRKELKDIPLEEITQFVAEQDVHKLEILAESIGRNGVQVPLTIRDDGKLLDGNRRYFACQWLKMQSDNEGTTPPDFLSRIPVQVIRKADLKKNATLELKILAEANFIPDLKIPWPLDAQARAIDQYYQQLRRDKKVDAEAAIEEVVAIFGIKRQRVSDLLETLKLTDGFISEEKTENAKLERRQIVEERFVYFWEFMNKAMKGRGAYTEPKELKEVRAMFFLLMAKGTNSPIKNVKQVEPLVQAKREPAAWDILKDAKGPNVNVAIAIVNEKKDIRKAEDKIRVFISWLKDAGDLPPRAKMLLEDLSKVAKEKARG